MAVVLQSMRIKSHGRNCDLDRSIFMLTVYEEALESRDLYETASALD